MIALLLSLALAQDPSAEHHRLKVELEQLVKKSAWSGVERTYKAMIGLQIPLDGNDHLVGGQAAIARGEPLIAIYRLQRVEMADPSLAEEARSAMSRIESQYGAVQITVAPGTEPELVRPEAPFAPDERAAVARATEKLASTGQYRGLLPVGYYKAGGVVLKVEAGRDWLVVTAP